MTTYGTHRSRNCAERGCSDNSKESDDKENNDGVISDVTTLCVNQGAVIYSSYNHLCYIFVLYHRSKRDCTGKKLKVVES